MMPSFSTRPALWSVLVLCAVSSLACVPAAADNLYKGGNWPSVAADNKAQGVGDIVTIVIYEAASASNRVSQKSGKKTDVGGGLSAGPISESGTLNFGGNYAGSGEVSRTEQLVARMTASVIDHLPNGDFLIEGQQKLLVNGENRDIIVRGRIRRADIDSNNSIPSSRIADAQISYDGKGFVSRSAKPGLLNKIFSFLGLG